MDTTSEYLAFAGHKLLFAGDLLAIAQAVQTHLKSPKADLPLVFERSSGRQIDIDPSGGSADLVRRYGQDKLTDVESSPAARQKTRGRPRLGVVGREVTLLPRHWQWLDQQRGGASAMLRRLIDQERKANSDEDRIRQAQDQSNRFMSALAGNLPGFEEATRALYLLDEAGFIRETSSWPKDVAAYALALAADAFA